MSSSIIAIELFLLQFFTRRREDKGGIPRRSTKLEKLEDMAGATASKFQNLASHVPANLDIDPRMLPQEAITTGIWLISSFPHIAEIITKERLRCKICHCILYCVSYAVYRVQFILKISVEKSHSPYTA